MEKGQKPRKKKLGSYPYISVVVSISFALFVLGLFGLLFLHTNKLTNIIRENIELQVYLNKNVNQSQITKLERTIATNDYVAQENGQPRITFVSKEEAAKQFVDQTGEDFTQFLGENPLRDAFLINIKSNYQNKLDSIETNLEQVSGVFDVVYVESLVHSINQNLAKISLVLVGFAALLIIIVIVLVNNTIKLAMFSQRFLIRSMQLVGATRMFIQKPFLIRSLIFGFVGGVIAIGMVYSVMMYANSKIPDLNKLQDFNLIMLLFGTLLLLGILLGFMSTLRAIKRYMQMSLDDLY